MIANEFWNTVGYTARIWLWTSFCYIFSFMSVVARSKKEIEGQRGEDRGFEGRQGEDAEKARELSEQHNQTEGDGDFDPEATRLSCESKEKRIREQDREIAQLQNRLLGYIVKKFKEGEVDRLPNTNRLEFKLSEGVISQLLDTNEVRTYYICRYDPEGEVPEHNHIQHQTVQVLEGKIEITIYSSSGDKIRSEMLEKGETFHINPYINHSTKSKNGARALITFEPPMVKTQDVEEY